MIASDLNNPEFSGAVNPDSRLAVLFYTDAVQNEFESQKEGRPIFHDVDMVKIMVPGDTTTSVIAFVREDHKARFPLQWAHFQNKHGGDPKEIGTPLSQWARLTRSQVEELRALKFFTVESIATASDAQLQRVGMIAGMAPYAFREHAGRFLKVAQGDSVAQAAEEKNKALEEENAKVKAEMQAKLDALTEQVQALMNAPKRGRPKKVVNE